MSVPANSRSGACIPAFAGVTADVGRKDRRPAQGRMPASMPGSCGSEHGNAGAPRFDEAILPHLDAAYNLARWLARDPVDAEDIVQDACVQALKYFASFRGDNGRAWLLQIVRTTAYARLRTRRKGVEISLASAGTDDGEGGLGMDIADPGPGPEAALAATQDLEQLLAAVAALPIDLRECLILREMEKFSYKEIAGITEVPTGTVMSRLSRARRRLTALRVANAAGPAAISS